MNYIEMAVPNPGERGRREFAGYNLTNKVAD